MKNKIKLLALIYSPEDQTVMNKWQNKYSSLFEIIEWSSPLVVPIQSAVAHYCQTENIDGLLIDDHAAYDPIVMSRVVDSLSHTEMLLFSVSNEASPVYGAISGRLSLSDEQCNVFVFASNENASKQAAQLAKVAV